MDWQTTASLCHSNVAWSWFKRRIHYGVLPRRDQHIPTLLSGSPQSLVTVIYVCVEQDPKHASPILRGAADTWPCT